MVIKDEFLIEIEQSHLPFSHNLNSRSTDHRACFQSLTTAMHQIALTLLTDSIYRCLLTLLELIDEHSAMIGLPISGSTQPPRTTGTLKIYRMSEQPRWQIVEVAARENKFAPNPPLHFSSYDTPGVSILD